MGAPAGERDNFERSDPVGGKIVEWVEYYKLGRYNFSVALAGYMGHVFATVKKKTHERPCKLILVKESLSLGACFWIVALYIV